MQWIGFPPSLKSVRGPSAGAPPLGKTKSQSNRAIFTFFFVFLFFFLSFLFFSISFWGSIVLFFWFMLWIVVIFFYVARSVCRRSLLSWDHALRVGLKVGSR